MSKRFTFTVKNDRGLHTRPSTELVKLCSRFKSELKLKYRKMEVNAKSLLGILMLAAAKGSKIVVEADGVDEKEAIDAIDQLVNKQFNVNF